MDKLIFETKGKDQLLNIIKHKKNVCFNFLNAYSIFLFKNNQNFRFALSHKETYNFPDGITISLACILKKLKKLPRLSGPPLTEELLEDQKFMKNKKHFFIDGKDKTIETLITKFKYLNKKNTDYLNPSFIKSDMFPKKEINKIIKKIKRFKPDYVWICVGNPRQEILASQLIDKINVNAIFSVGAAIDFLAGTKKQAPLLIRELGLEWLFRLITDFNHTGRKVIGSLRGFILSVKYVGFKS